MGKKYSGIITTVHALKYTHTVVLLRSNSYMHVSNSKYESAAAERDYN